MRTFSKWCRSIESIFLSRAAADDFCLRAAGSS